MSPALLIKSLYLEIIFALVRISNTKKDAANKEKLENEVNVWLL